jgi:hypothetical protein
MWPQLFMRSGLRPSWAIAHATCGKLLSFLFVLV